MKTFLFFTASDFGYIGPKLFVFETAKIAIQVLRSPTTEMYCYQRADSNSSQDDEIIN